MARTAMGWSVCLIHSSLISPNFTVPLTKLADLFSASSSSPFLIITARFSSNLQFPHSGKDESHSPLTDFLKSYDFSEPEIRKIIKSCPQLLSSRVSTTLKPKLDYLVECGFHGSALHRVITLDPGILGRSLHNHIKPRYKFLQAYFTEEVNLVITRNPSMLRRPDVELCVKYLKEEGVTDERITKLVAHPSIYIVGFGKNRLAELVEETKALGIHPADNMFIWYLRMFASMSKTSWKRKLEVFKSLGWSDRDIRVMLLRYPLCFEVSEEKLRKNMDFYINTLKIDPKAVISCPILLMYSLNGRIVPRFEVMKLLKEHNLLRSWKASTFFIDSDKQFIKRYIEKNLEQVPHLLQVYCDSKKARSDTARL